MQQSWDKYGLSWGRDVLKPADAVTLDGLDNLARKGLAIAYPMPRMVCTQPTLRLPAVVSADFGVRVICTNTGDPNAASPDGAYSVDGEPIKFVVPDNQTRGMDRTFTTGAGNHVAPGYHTVKTWRTQTTSPQTIIAASAMTFQYCVGTCDDQPAPTTAVVPNVVGKTKDDAIVSLGAVGLALGPVTAVFNAAPVDQVLSETPNAGAVVPVNTAVSLTVSKGLETVLVPNVVGHTESSATTLISDARLIVGSKTGAASATVPTGSVISQTPAADTSALIGSAVNLVLSTGPTLPPPSTLPAGTYSYVCDASGNCKLTFVKKP